MRRIVIGRHINGIPINPLEFLLDKEGKPMVFETEDAAKRYLREKGITEEEMYWMKFKEAGMVQVRNEKSCIEVCSEMNEWIDCIFLVDKKDEQETVKVLEKAFDDFWDQEDVCYGDWLKEKMEEAGIEFEMFFGEG